MTFDPFASPQSDSDKIPNISTEEVSDRFSATMKNIAIKEKEKETQVKASTLGVPYFDLKRFPISPEVLGLINEELSKDLSVICFYRGSNDIRIGAVDPTNPKVNEIIKNLAKKHHTEVKLYLISQTSFNHAFDLYKTIPKIRKMVGGVEITEEDIKKFEKEINTFRDLNKKLEEVSVTDMVTLIVAAAIKARTSDIHIEAEEHDIKVRFRIDGILQDVAEIDQEVWPKIISRIKLIAGLKINVDSRPQDGRFTIFLDKEKIDVRVSALPTAYGESVVMRLLMSSAVGINFEDLGLRGRAYDILKKEASKPNGMIITTGPTGSGKTTTLYAILNKLNDPANKIITIEDPVEYKLQGINQSQIDRSSKYTFASGLRSILRQDPDIIMVGEIRDLETAEIAINAALTGHLVVSTLHTNDAAGTIPRFLAMQVKPFLLAPSLNAMIGQRLVRRICEHCKVQTELDNQALSKAMRILSEISEASGSKIADNELKNLKFYKGAGCEQCQGLGYKGRVGIYEVMTMTKEIEKLIIAGQVSEYDMRETAIKQGMVTMIQDGLLKATDGITSVEEVFRVAKDVSG